MNILFLHRSYPAQFGGLANRLGDSGHVITYAAEQLNHTNCAWQNGWLIQIRLAPRAERSEAIDPLLREWEAGIQRSRTIESLVESLLKANRKPDLVIFQAGLGYGLLLGAFLPGVRTIAYAEWLFQRDLLQWIVNMPSKEDYCLLAVRNTLIQQELLGSDEIVSPTQWQRAQFPKELQGRIRVIFDGIDTDYFSPLPVKGAIILPSEYEDDIQIDPSDRLLTYATRGMEPIRGFPEFMGTLPHLLERIPELKVVIAGRDRQAYSYPATRNGGSWMKTCLELIERESWRRRVHFTGLLPYEKYREMLRRTDLHCSFSRPYVPSWSLMEAAACGAPLALNRGPATTGILPDSAQCVVDLDDPASMAKILQEGIQASIPASGVRASLLPEEYSRTDCLKKWLELLGMI